jgi:hypothetical protein
MLLKKTMFTYHLVPNSSQIGPNFGKLGSGGAKMTLWCHCWGCKQPHSASHIHNISIWSVWAPSYAVERHLGAPLHSYNGAGVGPNFGKLGSGGAKMTLRCHCWGCKPPHSASHIHTSSIWSVWAPSYAVERHLCAPLHSYNGAGGGSKFWINGVRRSKNDIVVSLFSL